MKKLLINIGQEAVVGVIYETAGKSKSLRRVMEIPCTDYYNNSGRLDIVRIVSAIKKILPREAKNLDIDLILPTYVTDVEYVDAIDDQYDKEEKKTVHSRAEKMVFVGESQTKKINQNIAFNSKELTTIISAFHREKLSVVRAISNISCYHNFMSLFNHTEMYGSMDFKTHICMVWGLSKVSYIFMLGNLPVELRVSDYSLTEVYKDLVASGCELPLYQVLKIMNNCYISTDPEAGLILEHSSNIITEGSRTIELSDTVIALVENAFYSYITNMVSEVRQIYDHVRNKYSTSNVYICANSRLLDECLCKALSDSFPIEYLNAKEKLEIYNDKFTLKSIPEITEKYVPIIGCAIEGIKKGSDFYDA